MSMFVTKSRRRADEAFGLPIFNDIRSRKTMPPNIELMSKRDFDEVNNNLLADLGKINKIILSERQLIDIFNLNCSKVPEKELVIAPIYDELWIEYEQQVGGGQDLKVKVGLFISWFDLNAIKTPLDRIFPELDTRVNACKHVVQVIVYGKAVENQGDKYLVTPAMLQAILFQCLTADYHEYGDLHYYGFRDFMNTEDAKSWALYPFNMVAVVLNAIAKSNASIVKTEPKMRKKGRENIPHSTLKTLKINLENHCLPSFLQDSVGDSGIHHRYHAVRGHWRHYKTGRATWVNAHFRGNKELGTIYNTEIELLTA